MLARVRTTLAILSCLLVVASLFMPGTTILDSPVWGLVVFAAVALIQGAGLGAPLLLLVGPASFICAWASRRRPSSILAMVAWSIAISGLLSVWLFPVVAGIADGVGPMGGFSDLRWGYYLFGAAHTLMFLFCVTMPGREKSTDRRRGFSVISPNV